MNERLSRRKKPEDLGLEPVFDGDELDLKLSRKDIQGASRTLAALATNPRRDTGVVDVLIGEIRDDLSKQLGYAIRREEQEKERFAWIKSLAAKLVDNIDLDFSDKNVQSNLAAGTAVLISLAAIGYGLLDYSSPASIEARKQAQIQQEAALKEAQTLFEKDHVLGTSPSSVSYNGWRVRLISEDEKKDLVSRTGQGNPFLVNNGGSICSDNSMRINNCSSTSSSFTGISMQSYTTLPGQNTVELDVNLGGSPTAYEKSISGGTNNQTAVAFDYPAEKRTIFANISLTKSTEPKIQVDVQERKVAP